MTDIANVVQCEAVKLSINTKLYANVYSVGIYERNSN